MTCDLCEQNPGLFMVGNMETGDQLVMCASCYARNGLEAAKAILPPAELVAAAEAVQPPPAETPPSEAPEGTRRPKRKGASEEPQPPQIASSGPDEVPTATEDGGN